MLWKPLVLEVGIRFSALKQVLFQLQDLYNDVASFASLSPTAVIFGKKKNMYTFWYTTGECVKMMKSAAGPRNLLGYQTRQTMFI
jgi:hypothetical protein